MFETKKVFSTRGGEWTVDIIVFRRILILYSTVSCLPQVAILWRSRYFSSFSGHFYAHDKHFVGVSLIGYPAISIQNAF